MKLLLAGGGTGGHLVPGLAVAAALKRRDPDCRVWVFGTPRSIDRKLVPGAGLPLIEQAVRPFSTRPWKWPRFYRCWQKSCRAARLFIEEHRPDAVLGLGGYAAGPAVKVAHKMGLPTAILNPDAVPGRANRYLAKIADLVFCQWGITVGRMPVPARCRVVGCPTRADLGMLDRAACRRQLGLDENLPLLLITGASQGASTINDALPPALESVAPKLSERWQVLHQTGAGRGAVTELAGVAGERFDYRCVEFIDRMGEALAAADLVVARAGAATLAELTVIGRPALLLPYPYHRDQHQRHNAQVLVHQHAAVMRQDERDTQANATHIADVLAHLMADRARREQMGAAARKMGRPDAADAVLDELEKLMN